MAFTDLDEHLAEVFGQGQGWPEQVNGIDFRRRAAKAQTERGRRPWIRKVPESCKATAEIPPGRWTKVRGEWVKAL